MPVSGLLAGAVCALGLALAVREVLPRRPDLVEVLRRVHGPTAPAPTLLPGGGREKGAELADRVGVRLLRSGWVAARLPRRDLVLLEMSPARLVGRCVLYGVVGLALPQALMVMLTLLGTPPPFAVPVVVSLLVAAGLVVKCLDEVRQEAAAARETWRHVTASLLARASLIRGADVGAADALYRVAEHGDGPAFRRIRAALERARLAGESPWDALRRLGEELGVEELARPAQTFALAGEEKAGVTRALEAQARALRVTISADEKARANQITERMVLPTLVVALLLLVFMAYPAFYRILNV